MNNMLRRWRLSTSTLAIVAMSSGLMGISPAFAMDAPPVMFDVTLLQADAIIFAQVDAIKIADDDPSLVEIELGDIDVLHSRWDLKRTPLNRFRLVASLAQDGGSARAVPVHQRELVAGRKYVLMLRGGEWTVTPLIGEVLEIDGDRVRCGSGHVYGVDIYGVVCGVAENQAGKPLSADAFRRSLVRAIDKAHSRRPELAAKLKASSRPLNLERHGR